MQAKQWQHPNSLHKVALEHVERIIHGDEASRNEGYINLNGEELYQCMGCGGMETQPCLRMEVL